MKRWILVGIVLAQAVAMASAEGITLGGVVSTLTDGGLPKAKVELFSLPGNFETSRLILEEGRLSDLPAATVTTDPEGRFLIEVPAVAMWSLVVRAEGFVPMHYSPLPVVGDKELPPVTLVRDAETRVEVRGAGRRPAAGVWVLAVSAGAEVWKSVARHGWQPSLRAGRSDGEGKVTLARTAEEKLDLYVFPGGSRPIARSGVRASARVDLPSSDAAPRFVEVVDPEGRPLVGAVLVDREHGWPLGRLAAGGRFEIRGQGLRAMDLQLLTTAGRSGEVQLPQPPEVREQKPYRLVGPSAEAPRFRGHVIELGTGRPIAGALVWPGHDPGAFVRSDEKGGYELRIHASQRFWVQAEAAGFLPRIGGIDGRESSAGTAPTLVLVDAQGLAGAVVDSAGQPVGGSRVVAKTVAPSQHPRFFRRDSAISRSASGGAGLFYLPGLAAGGVYELTVDKVGFSTARSRVTIDPWVSQDLRIVLKRPRPVFGRVMDDEERPVSGVEVRLVASQRPDHREREPMTSTSDAAGRFELARMPAPTVDLEARKPGYSPLAVRRLEAPPGEGPIDLGTLILVPGSSLRGQVTDVEGVGIEGVSVWLSEDTGRLFPSLSRLKKGVARVVSDPEGMFRIEDLPPRRRVHLAFGREGYLSDSILGLAVPHEDSLLVVLKRGAELSGRVVSEDGEGLAGARVSVHGRDLPQGTLDVRSHGDESAESVRTDESGAFLISGAAPGPIVLDALADGYQPSPPLEVDLAEGEAAEGLELVLARGATVEGRIENQRGEPVANAAIWFGRVFVSSDTEGFYRLDGAVTGTQTVEVRHPGYERIFEEIDVDVGMNRADFLLNGGFGLAGYVFDEAGAPLRGARVELSLSDLRRPRDYRTKTDAAGRFEFSEVVEGSYDLLAAMTGYSTGHWEDYVTLAGASVDGIEVRLTKGTVVSGRVLGLEFDELAVVEVGAEQEGRIQPGTVDYAGRFEVTDLGPGVWLIRAALNGGTRHAQARVVVEPGTRRLTRDLEFDHGLAVTGQVLHGETPLRGAMVSVLGSEVAVQRSVLTDHEGRFRLEDLEAGRYQLSLTHPEELITHHKEVEVRGDRELRIELATSRLRGFVISAATARPIPAAQVHLQRLLGPEGSQPGPLTTLTTSAEGSFAVLRLAAGRHRVAVRKAGHAPVEEVLELAPGEDRTVELTLAPTAGLALMARLASGRLPPFVAVTVFGSSGEILTTQSRELSSQGQALFDTVPPGTWEVLVTAPGGAVRRTRVSVPGRPVEVVLPDAGRLLVRVASLSETQRLATLTVFDQQGRRFEGLDTAGVLRRQWSLVGGQVIVDAIPAGVWNLTVAASDGQRWEGVAVTSGARQAEVGLE